MSYAEAIKIIGHKDNLQTQNTKVNAPTIHSYQTGLITDKLVLFLAYVINCSEQARTKTEKIKIIVKAAAKFLNMKDLSWEKMHADLSQGEPSSEGILQIIS